MPISISMTIHWLVFGLFLVLLDSPRRSDPLFTCSLHLQTRFTTGNDDHVGDDYFLTSGDKIRFFLEKDAFDQDGKLTRPKEKAVNKIGHG